MLINSARFRPLSTNVNSARCQVKSREQIGFSNQNFLVRNTTCDTNQKPMLGNELVEFADRNDLSLGSSPPLPLTPSPEVFPKHIFVDVTKPIP
ncbi:hypothetical protein CEXT_9931 [Caerostris extrusa]|uniref:Uncharacterized protein n=1 Tax=Caerostris extrusa TaxID=172846 RepID=A0AAV4N197_CAEEX|nr:hypothetical protein CEXT_9931 [Caerostris extrusa]